MNKLTRSALIATGTVGSALALVGPASAATPTALSTTPPDPTTVIPQMGGELSNGVVDGFVTLLPLRDPGPGDLHRVGLREAARRREEGRPLILEVRRACQAG